MKTKFLNGENHWNYDRSFMFDCHSLVTMWGPPVSCWKTLISLENSTLTLKFKRKALEVSTWFGKCSLFLSSKDWSSLTATWWSAPSTRLCIMRYFGSGAEKFGFLYRKKALMLGEHLSTKEKKEKDFSGDNNIFFFPQGQYISLTPKSSHILLPKKKIQPHTDIQCFPVPARLCFFFFSIRKIYFIDSKWRKHKCLLLND